MRFSRLQATQLLADLDAIVKRADSPAAALTAWLRDFPDEAVHIYPESMVMQWKERNPLVKDGDAA